MLKNTLKKYTFVKKKKKTLCKTQECVISIFFQKSYKNMVSNTIFYIMNTQNIIYFFLKKITILFNSKF